VSGVAEALQYSPFDYRVHEDPYPFYARLREEAPVYRNEAFDFWALSRHEDVLGAFRDVDRFSNRNGVSIEPSAFGPHAYRTMSFLAMDPPRHTRMRSLVGKGFSPRRVADMEPDIRALTLRHLGPALEAGSFDMIADVAGKLPMDVVSELMGVPEADRAELRRLSDLVLHRQEGLNDVPAEGMEAALVLAGYYADMVSERRRRPGTDLTSALLEAEIEGERLSDEDIVAFLFLMVVAGNETTTKLLGNAWYWAWRFPDEREKAFADPALVPGWVEETLRYDTSSQMIARTTNAKIPLHGTAIPAEARVLLLVGSANRDPRAFEGPDRYDIGRDNTKLVSFGSGRHFCMGAALARMEGRVALEELVHRVADYEIDEAGAERVHSINVRGFASLPTNVRLR
jgi:cytochrome P450